MVQNQSTSSCSECNEHPSTQNNYQAVKVLLLTFQFNDLNLEDETGRVEAAFKAVGYEVKPCTIMMEDSLSNLQRELETFLACEDESTLLIIYYHGHGGLLEDNKFTLTSHNYPSRDKLWETLLDFSDTDQILKGLQNYLKEEGGRCQRIAKIRWEDIRGAIKAAKCDTLIILDCCEAGLAATTLDKNFEVEQPRTKNRKELIGACGWGTSTWNRMSTAICKVLDTCFVNLGDRSMSTFTLVSEMNDRLVKDFVGEGLAPQAVHYVLGLTSKAKISLPNLKRDRSRRSDT